MPAPDGRVVLLVTSPRVAPGLLAWPAWQHLVTADAVLAAGLDEGWAAAFGQAGVRVEDVEGLPVPARADRLVELAAPGHEAVWVGSPDGDPGLMDSLAERLAGRAADDPPPEIELVVGSHDVPGGRLLDLVAVMDRLRSPGGCPWDAGQTHRSLVPYLLEEAHEVVEAIESGDRDHLVEELGDLLLQVVFHARVGEEREVEPFDVDEVAGGIVAKLVRRHPHVFGGVEAGSTEQVHENWEQIKAAEKRRTGPFEGIPLTLPSLARAQKMLARLERSVGSEAAGELFAASAVGDDVATLLVDAVRCASGAGTDAESVLREALRRLGGSLPAADGPDGSGGLDGSGHRAEV